MTRQQRHTIAALLDQLERMASELSNASADSLAKAQTGTNNGEFPHYAYRLGALEFQTASKGESLRRLIGRTRDELGLKTATQAEAVTL